jgi:hypothetical protein
MIASATSDIIDSPQWLHDKDMLWRMQQVQLASGSWNTWSFRNQWECRTQKAEIRLAMTWSWFAELWDLAQVCENIQSEYFWVPLILNI